MRVIATAGHVDHGKSTLVKALTGTDPDRWAEEKERGLTIDLGFAATTLPSGREIGFVDVPGHGRLVRNMLAGVGSVDACLFVVAATEGWKEQSEEHLGILETVGVSDGVVALTKVGLADAELTDLAAAEVQERLSGTFLAGAEMVGIDVHAGLGLGELRRALDALVGRLPEPADRGRPRLWVDRSFSIRGAGTVVTGTLTGGSLATGMQVAIEPGGHHGRVRSMQSHFTTIEQASPGRRLAVNLGGLARPDAGRGQALVLPDQWHLTSSFDARLSVLASLGHAVGNRGAYVVHLGSGQFPARLRLIEGREVNPGDSAPARFWLRAGLGLPLTPGDRYVLREEGRFETVGGGEILDTEPVLPTSRCRPSRSVSRVVSERGWVDAGHLYRITGERIAPDLGRWVVDPPVLEAKRQRLLERCREAGPRGVSLSAMDELERVMAADGVGGIEVHGGRVVEASLREALSEDAEAVLRTLDRGGCAPDVLPAAERGSLRELERAGLAIDADGSWFATSAVLWAVERLSSLLAVNEEGFTVSEARDALGSSRKHVLPLLNHLDGSGVTRRRGDRRVAGPKLAPDAVGMPDGAQSREHQSRDQRSMQ